MSDFRSPLLLASSFWLKLAIIYAARCRSNSFPSMHPCIHHYTHSLKLMHHVQQTCTPTFWTLVIVDAIASVQTSEPETLVMVLDLFLLGSRTTLTVEHVASLCNTRDRPCLTQNIHLSDTSSCSCSTLRIQLFDRSRSHY